jgi:hypothetical protein
VAHATRFADRGEPPYGAHARFSGQEVLMTENTMTTNIAPKIELTDPDQAAKQARQDHAGLLDSQMQLSQREPLTKPAA